MKRVIKFSKGDISSRRGEVGVHSSPECGIVRKLFCHGGSYVAGGVWSVLQGAIVGVVSESAS